MDTTISWELVRTIFILHYHLNPGGVTRIIESQARALRRLDPHCPVVVLTGGDDGGHMMLRDMGVRIEKNGLLNYLPQTTTPEQAKETLAAMHDFLSAKVGPGDILHAHNINLGKNPLLTLAVYRLAESGIAVVNHCHDFAEDRPANYRFLKRMLEPLARRPLEEILYPDLPRLVYVVLNSTDKQKLISYGVKANKVFHVPNPVGEPRGGISKEAAKALLQKSLGLHKSRMIITFPVRVIRRKNIGEFILLAHLFKSRSHWLVTQAPKNPVEIEHYLQWKEFCRKHSIAVHFEVGDRLDFETIMRGSDACISTSVQEGFGMAFMEPWSFGTPVIGRDIPSVTLDLKKMGVRLPMLYNELIVVFNGQSRDFAELSMEEQMSFIKSVIDTPAVAEQIIRLNPFLKTALEPPKIGLIAHNQEVLKKDFTIAAYGKRLFAIYDSIAQGSGYS